MPANISTKGRSTSATTVAEPMKARTDSKDCRVAAKEPVEAGRASMRSPSTRAMIDDDSLTSARLAARSTKALRIRRSARSKQSTTKMPMASTHSVSVAWLGTTRS